MLLSKLKECDAIKYGNFTLSSGKKSNYYIDVKKAATKPEILRLISKNIKQRIRHISQDYIGCVELGGVPIAVAVSLETDIPLLIIRKQEKGYGIKDIIIGDFEKDKKVTLIEDVTTTGGSVIKAIKILRDSGLIVNHVISVVDRGEGATESLKKERVDLISILKIR